MVIAGESAGANLTMALTIACCYPRPEPWAKAVFDAGVVPLVVAPACGIFQVSDADRYRRAGLTNWFSQSVMVDCEDCYLPHADQRPWPGRPSLHHRGRGAHPPSSPGVLPVGSADPLEDNRRLNQALVARGVRTLERVYPGEPHAFHALIFRKAARECWREMLTFVEGHTDPES